MLDNHSNLDQSQQTPMNDWDRDTPAMDVIQKSRMVTEVDLICPHCNEIIGEKAQYYDGTDWYHTSCGKRLIQPPLTDEQCEALHQFEQSPGIAIPESSPKSTNERVIRRVRLDNLEPATKDLDNVPKKQADNSPTKTSRGRQALKRRIKKNKTHASDFKEQVEALLNIDDAKRISIIAELKDPITLSCIINEMQKTDKRDCLNRLDEAIHNIWNGKLIRKSIGLTRAGITHGATVDAELELFDEACRVVKEFSDWGIPFSWIERNRKGDFIIYEALGDWPPSKTYMEHRSDPCRHMLTIDDDRANIIQMIYGDK